MVGAAEIRAEMDHVVAEVSSVLDIPAECARTLLIHFRCGCKGCLCALCSVCATVAALPPSQVEQGAAF